MRNFVLTLLLTLLVSSAFAAKKGVKSVSAKKILAQATQNDLDFENMDLRNVASNMANHEDVQNYDFNQDPTGHHLEMKNLIAQIDAMKPLYVNCPADGSQDCDQFEYRVPKVQNFLFDGVYHASTDELTKFFVFASPACPDVSLPTPYLENTVIKTCLSANGAAKKFATKVIKQSVVGVFGSQYQDSEKYKCQHMILDNNGNATVNEKPCVDLSEGSNLVKCFFELKSEFAFNLNYECFFPQLWRTWFASFSKVYHAMKGKGYSVTTDNLQARHCYWMRQQNCAAIFGTGVSNPACGTPVVDDHKCLITYNDFCQATLTSNDWPDLFDSEGNAMGADAEIVSARDWLNNNAPSGYVNRHAEQNALCGNRNADDGNFSPDWHGRVCNSASLVGPPVTAAYYECLLDYPLIKIEKLLEGGALEFPVAQFEKKTPTTMIMIGFEQECKRYYQATVEAPLAPNALWTDCMDFYYPTRTDDSDVDLACADYTVNMMFQCLNTHAGCTEYDEGFDYAALTDEQKKPWNVTCGTATTEMRARRTGTQCDPTQFKTLCLEERWNGWDYNGSDADSMTYAQMMADGAITKTESDNFLADGVNSNILDAVHDVLGIEVHKATDYNAELGADLGNSESTAIDSLDIAL